MYFKNESLDGCLAFLLSPPLASPPSLHSLACLHIADRIIKECPCSTHSAFFHAPFSLNGTLKGIAGIEPKRLAEVTAAAGEGQGAAEAE